jgi:molybdopterin-guanine dinucleotide biosynthesis protein A
MAIAGIFVGGKARRMGGVAKGLLVAPTGETIVARWASIFGALGVEAVLVGASGAYSASGLASIADDPPGIGPLGGLAALLARAGDADAIAVACDMPYVTEALVARLLAHARGAPAVAPRRDARWEPLFARYAAPLALPIARRRIAGGRHGLQGLLDEAGATELPLDRAESAALDDWDAPEHMR